jgi:hypothetical protein
LIAVLAMMLATLFLTRPSAQAGADRHISYQHLKLVHKATVGRTIQHISPKDSSVVNNEIHNDFEGTPKVPNGSGSGGPPPTNTPSPSPIKVVTNNPSAFSGFSGLTHADQRLAGTDAYVNTQFSLEPPDQGLCANNSFVVEAINNAMAIYDTTGNMLSGPTALSQFFGFAPEIDRNTGITGPFISDPKCYYDNATSTWFLTELEQDNGTNPGATNRNYNVVAVSLTSDPTGAWAVFTYDVTDDGANGTPAHGGCPCFGDQPLIGADGYGFYMTTNEFSETSFNGAQVYAMSKSRLEDAAHGGALPTIVHINAADYLASYGGLSYSLQPAERAPGDNNADDAANQSKYKGIEYMMSALQFGPAPLDDRIAVWALTNTKSLTRSQPDVAIHVRVIHSYIYGQPPAARQKFGPLPLRDYLYQTPNPYCPNADSTPGKCPFSPMETLNSNDDRMNQVSFSQNLLYGPVNTVIQAPGQNARVGIAYFIVRPNWNNNSLGAKMYQQGYVAADQMSSVLFPSIAVNASGEGIMSFTIVGAHRFPGMAYIHINGTGVYGNIYIGGAGQGLDDGFTGYVPFAPDGIARWGDYSAAVAMPDGSIWLANEYIPNAPRTILANWGTFIGHYTLS